MKRFCESDGCDNEVRRHQTRCDDCIAEEARRRKRRRETTESGVRGGQGRSGQQVEDSAVIGGLAMLGLVVLLGGASITNCLSGRESSVHDRPVRRWYRGGVMVVREEGNPDLLMSQRPTTVKIYDDGELRRTVSGDPLGFHRVRRADRYEIWRNGELVDMLVPEGRERRRLQ